MLSKNIISSFNSTSSRLLSSNKRTSSYLNKRFFSTEESPYPTFTIGLIAGDGIGKEVIPCAERLLSEIPTEMIKANFQFIKLDAGWETFQKTGNALPKETIDQLKKCNGALFGAVSSPVTKVEGYSSPIVGMRKALDLYANIRPAFSSPLLNTKAGVDMVIVRENTECLYVKRERLEDNGNTAIAERVITRKASTRIAEMAFKIATKRLAERSKESRKKARVTIVHKSNVLSVTDGLFRECCFEVAKKYPNIPVEEQIVDSMVYKLILNPVYYDVVVAPNLYGDILSDASAALVGGLGVVPSSNVGDAFAMGEPVHGSAPDIAGKGIANPVGTLRSASMLLQTMLGLENPKRICDAIEEAISFTMRTGTKTQDCGGKNTTKQVTESVITNMKQILAR